MIQCSIKGLVKCLARVSMVFGLLLFFGCGGGSGGDDDDKGKNSNSNSNNYPKSSVLGGSGSDGETKSISGIECVLVKAGTFVMGSPTNEANRDGGETQHQVKLTKDYWVSKYPVTQKQYQTAMGTNPSYFSGDSLPVESVSWDEAVAFCNKVGGRLLTEAEWEFAARGGNRSSGYKIYSGSNDINQVAWYWDNIPSQNSSNSGYGTQPVGKKSPNELGIYDMSGNVWEWVNDWYSAYSSNAQTNPAGPVNGSYRVNRGGSWSRNAWDCRVAARYNNSPSSRYGGLGLRVAFDAN